MNKILLAVLAISAPSIFAQSLAITTAPALPVATVGQAYSVQISATGGTTPYIWHFESGVSASPRFSISSSGLLTGTATSADLGVLTFYVQVTDATSTTVTKQLSVTVQTTQPLALTTTAFPAGVVGIPYSVQLGSSGGTPPYKWAVLPAIVTFPVPGQVSPGLMLDSGSGLVTGTPTTTGTFGFTITLTDNAQGSVSRPFTLTVTAGGPLSIVTTSLQNGTIGANYSQALQANGGVPPYKWAIATGSLPNGLTLDPNAGVISGAPLAAANGSFSVMVTDSATTPNTAKQSLSITVAAPPTLAVTTRSLPAGTQGGPYSQQLAATGGIAPYTWSLTSGSLPAGLSLSASNGVISGTPTSNGASTFTVQVADSAVGTSAKASQSLSISIAQLTSVLAVSGALPGGAVNLPYSQTLPASGGAPPYSWSVVAGSLPPGLLLSGSGTLTGVPTVASTFGFTAQVVDASGGSALGTFSVTAASASLSLFPLIVPSGVAGAAYPSQVIQAIGGTPPYTYSIQGALPAGLNLTNGLISGTPATAGTTSFTIKVTDSAQATATSPQQLVVRASTPPDLVLSSGELSFSLAAGSTDVPEPQAFTVASSNISNALTYQVTVSPAAPWLNISGGPGSTAVTPGGISVSLNSQALALAAATAPYTTSISVTCMMPSACSGSAQKVVVALTASAPAPQLSLTRSVLALTVNSAASQASGLLGLQNVGGGSITVNSVNAADPWLSVSGSPATLAAGPATYLTVTANAAGLAAGLYRSTITVATSAGNANVPVTLLVSTSPTMTLSPAGQLFQMSAGGVVGNPNGAVEVLAGGGAMVNWGASKLPGSAWLILQTATGVSTASNPTYVRYSIDAAGSAALAAGTYYGTIRVTSSQVTNTPQDFVVILNVAAGGTLADPDPEPSGLLFIANGTAAIPPQSVTLYAGSATAVPYQAAAMTTSGSSGFTVTPTSGTASAATPGLSSIAVTASGLTPGVYRGVVTYEFSPASVRSANVTLIVPNIVGGSPFERQALPALESPRAGGTCTPSKLVPTATGIPSNFSPQLSWPTPLSILLTDDCGTVIANGTVDATFNNGDPELPLAADPANPGRYAGTWTPHGAAAQVTVTASALAPGLASAKVQVSGKITPNLAPALTTGGTLNVFNPVLGGGIAPGTAVAIYGSNFAPAGTSAIASAVPFATTLNNVSVVIGGVPAPLYFVSPGQINAQVPFELLPGNSYQIIVNANGALTTPDHFVSASGAPGVAAFGNGGIIAQHLDFSLIGESSAARPGEAIILYLTGLGSTANQPATGSPAPAPPTGPVNTVTVLLDGTPVPTLFVGLTPGSIGLYQIDFNVPAGTTDGDHVLTIAQASAVSNVTILPVHQ